jgi:thermitase
VTISSRYGIILLSVLLSASLAPFASSARGEVGEHALDVGADGTPYAAGELLVTYRDDATEASVSTLDEAVDGEVEEDIPELDATLIEFPEIQAEASGEVREEELAARKRELEDDPAVESVEYNYVMEAQFAPDDPRFGEQWGMKKANFDAAWEGTRGGSRTEIAFVDSGADVGHPDLKGKISAKRDFRNDESPRTVVDNTGHGTHLAGIAAANTDNGVGVAGGCPRCSILVAKVIGAEGTAYVSDVADGIVWSTKQGADVINLSLGSTQDSTVRRNAVEYATDRRVVVVACAGNYGTSTPVYPAAYPRVIGVSYTGREDRIDSDSSHGGWVDVAAPGVGILSTSPSGYDSRTGSSISAPHVSALAGLLVHRGYKNPANVQRRIKSTAVDLGAPGRDPYYGAGRIDAARAVR